MKIGTITFHSAENFGAVLQAYALQRAVETLGADCQIIDYRCSSIENSYRRFLVESKSIKGIISAFVYFPIRCVRRKKFNLFKKKYFNTTEQIYYKDNINKVNQYFDAFITGSDQVWNTDLTNGDLNYFLAFADEAKKKYSYAASIGKNKLSDNEEKHCEQLLRRFDGISVREQNALEYLSELLSRDIKLVMDPVFLLSEDEWKKIVSERIVKEKYIFVLKYHDRCVYDYAKYLKNRLGYKIISVETSLRSSTEIKKDYFADPSKLLNYIYFAEAVVTDSFHVSAFSLIFKKNLTPVLQRKKTGMNGRIVSLMNILKQQDCVIIPEKTSFEEVKMIDYNVVAPILSDMINDSKKYLQSICTER